MGGQAVFSPASFWFMQLRWNPSIYNMIGWVAWSMGQKNRRPRLWCSTSKYYYVFIVSCKTLCKNRFNLFSYFFFIKLQKLKMKSFECPKSIESIKKINTRNIKLFVQATQRNILWIDGFMVLYSHLWSCQTLQDEKIHSL